MRKSIHTPAYREVLTRLKRARRQAGLTQAQLAERLGATQTFVSKVERGERRLDIVETRSICAAVGVSFVEFAAALEGGGR
jgi:transcriptional regulator with XRE-family HTH domain